ncbi:MAG: IS3 family transposase [Nocardioidaceae bacterium]|nr:IS3 family transposase [Nocardioidaceae bacterium]
MWRRLRRGRTTLTDVQQSTYDTGLAAESELISTLREEACLSQNRTLELIGLSKSAFHYRSRPRPRTQAPVPQSQRRHPGSLSDAERSGVVSLLTASSLSVAETYYQHLDSGDYLASMSTFHRIARSEKIPMATTGPRRRAPRLVAERPAPQLRATGPGQVLCWDITYLPGRYRGISYALYLIIDLFSRMICGWTIQDREDHIIAAELMDAVLIDAGGTVVTVHSDNGGAMTAKRMAKILAKHGAGQSLIRPGVSNDNAQSESLFRTVKYGPTWPGAFTDIAHATTWFTEFTHVYNTEHHHSGLAGYTPAQVHEGTWIDIAHTRQDTLDAAHRAHPERYRHRPQVRIPAQTVSLNLGHDDGKTHTPPTLLELLAG